MEQTKLVERLSSFRKKSVINISDGSCLGNVTDIEFDTVSACILKIIVSKKKSVCSLLCESECYAIPYRKIVRVGEDIILVDVCPENVRENC